MRILVYGAGVLGGNLANNLFHAKKDVTLLARGKWAETIQQNGLIVQNKFSPKTTVSRLPVITELKPEDTYDVIFVVMRYTQLDSMLFPVGDRFLANILSCTNPYSWTFTLASGGPCCDCHYCHHGK